MRLRTSIAVAVINYNTRDLLRACLESALPERPRELIVVDNGSTDGSVEMIRTEFDAVVLDVDGVNRGYGTAANRAVRRSSADAVLLLNSDTRLHTGALAALQEYFDAYPKAGIIGPRLVNADGSLQRSCHNFPTPGVTLLEYSWLGDLARKLAWSRERYLPASAHEHARPVDWVTGAALLIRRTAFDAVRGFDERFFLYFEEVDLAYRMMNAGWETHFAPVTDVTHIGAASTSQRFEPMYAQQFAALLQYYELHRPAQLPRARAAIRLAMASKLAWYSFERIYTRNDTKRAMIERSIPVWWRVLMTPHGK
jgi:GT2 family glycosyltransferase